jgi:hypothetical protein
MFRVPPRNLVSESGPLLLRFLLALRGVQAGPATTVTSWYRSPTENALVGGHVESQHLLGLAIDVVALPTPSLDQARRNGLVVVVESTHAHLQFGPPGFLRAQGLLSLAHRV